MSRGSGSDSAEPEMIQQTGYRLLNISTGPREAWTRLMKGD